MYIAYCDGGARGNPGPAAYAAIIKDDTGPKVRISGYLGKQTNNYAEYQGLLAILDYVAHSEVKAVKVYSDSLLVVCQINKRWRVKNPEIRDLWEQCYELIHTLDFFEIYHVPREMNKQADELVNRVLDREGY